MEVKALRGVCIGPGKHLVAGETADLDPATTQFLVSIGAVEQVIAPPAPAEAKSEPESAPVKPGKKER